MIGFERATDVLNRRVLSNAGLVGALVLIMAPAGAILATVLLPVNFLTALIIAVPVGIAAMAVILAIAHSESERGLRRRVFVGFCAGMAGLAAYDLIRLCLQGLGLVHSPFKAIVLYGESLASGSTLAPTLGWGFHIWNGLSFAIFYIIIVRVPSVLTAVIWALCLDLLQTLTVTKMPGIEIGQEFLTASVVGHLAFGCAVGAVGGRMLKVTRKEVA